MHDGPNPSTRACDCPSEIRYTGVVHDSEEIDDPVLSVNVLGHTEDEVYQGLFTTITQWIIAGGQHNLPGWWLEQNPIAGVRLNEPGAAQDWLESFREAATYPYWTVLDSGSLLDMRQTPGHSH